MEKDKLYLINKIFNDKKVRTVWNKESEKYYVSVVDVVGIISDSKNKQAYWRKLKQRLKEDKLSHFEIKSSRWQISYD